MNMAPQSGMSSARDEVIAGVERLGVWITSVCLEDIPQPILERAVRRHQDGVNGH